MLPFSSRVAVQGKLPDGLNVRREILQVGFGDRTTEMLVGLGEFHSIGVSGAERTYVFPSRTKAGRVLSRGRKESTAIDGIVGFLSIQSQH